MTTAAAKDFLSWHSEKEKINSLPLSTSKKHGAVFFLFSFLPKVVSNVLLSQLRIFDARRLVTKAGTLSKNDFYNIKKAIKRLI